MLQTFVVPDPAVVTLFDGGTALGDTPQSLRDRCGFVQVQLWVCFLNGISGGLSLVVRNGRVKVMGNVSGTDLVVQKVDQTPRVHLVIGTVDCVERTLDKAMVVFRKVRHINVGVLQPVEE